MKMIVGLGNPGLKYKNTWHNMGFTALNSIKLENTGAPISWIQKSDWRADVAEEKVDGKKVIFLKPSTYMNNSGEAVYIASQYYNIEPKDIWVVHDDIDLPVGTIRISKSASAGGHNGVKSVIRLLGTQDFVRFRIGVRPLRQEVVDTKEYVLQKIGRYGKIHVVTGLQNTVNALQLALTKGVDAAMNKYN